MLRATFYLALTSTALILSCDTSGTTVDPTGGTPITPEPGETSVDEPTAGGFCNPGRPNTPDTDHAIAGDGEDCDRAAAEAKARKAWATNSCTGDTDPRCPSGCVDTSQTCQAAPDYNSDWEDEVMSCSLADHRDCEEGMWRCSFNSTTLKRVGCGCACS